MPELPEVETIRRGLLHLIGDRIEGIEKSDKALRLAGPAPLGDAVGQKILAVTRHGKFLTFNLEQGALIFHLGMTGKLLLGFGRDPHTHVRLQIGDEELRFVDPRRFGSVQYEPRGAPSRRDHYGPDALSPDFSPDFLAQKLQSSKAPLKAFLLNQTKVAGIGNIYACEALWRAQLSPRRLANNTPRAKVALLHQSILDVLTAAITRGGTSFNDYVNSIGEKGSFLFEVAVFQRAGETCKRCGNDIRRIIQSGRSTFYCPGCQR